MFFAGGGQTHVKQKLNTNLSCCPFVELPVVFLGTCFGDFLALCAKSARYAAGCDFEKLGASTIPPLGSEMWKHMVNIILEF